LGLFRVESSLSEKVLVPQQDGHIRGARHAVEPVLVSCKLDMRGTHSADIRVAFHLIGNVGHETRLYEIWHEDEIDRQDVRHIAGGCSGSELRYHLRARNDCQLDLIVVTCIPGIHNLSS
jgi:hypothetical protein